jgi:hypothetical protein
MCLLLEVRFDGFFYETSSFLDINDRGSEPSITGFFEAPITSSCAKVMMMFGDG